MEARFPANPAANRKELRAVLRGLLLNRALAQLAHRALERRDVERVLNGLLFDSEELVRWRAIEAIGRIAAFKAGSRMESVREMIRRLLWAMNDESGNSLRHAPQLMGEILANVPGLIPEFAHYLPSFRESSMHQKGTVWAMARIGTVAPHAFDGCLDEWIGFLRDPDPEIRGLALLALGPDAGEPAALLIRSLQHDPSSLRYYDPARGDFLDTSVGEMARSALARRK